MAQMLALSSPLAEISNIQARFIPKLKRLGLETVRDLLYHFPVRYEDFSQIYKIDELIPNQEATVQGEVDEVSGRSTWQRHLYIVEAFITDDSGSIRAVWFNQPYIKNVLTPGRLANFSGKVSVDKNGALYLSNPTYELIKHGLPRINTLIDTDNISENPHKNQRESAFIHTGRIVPIYPETRGLTSKGIRYLIEPLLNEVRAEEPIPDEIRISEGFPEINEGLRAIHFPNDIADALAAKKRFAFEDLLLLQLRNIRERAALAREQAPAIPTEISRVKEDMTALPFALTDSQKQALWEILRDIAKPHPMNRLLQGDVGSGKTVLAVLAALAAARAGLQTAFMAPTEILARQHYRTFTTLFPSFDGNAALLTGSEARACYGHGMETEMDKTKLKRDIGNGKIAITFGTHALIAGKKKKRTEDIGKGNVVFKNLGLVVIDEQHRFGVKQRAALLHDANDANSPEYRELPSEQEKIVEKELSYQLQGIFYKIQDKIGRFARERQCADELEQELKNHNLSYKRELPIAVGNRKSNFADFVVENKILIEIKNVPFLTKEDYAQTMRYLNAGNLKLGLLVNFRQKYLKAKRILNSHFASFASDSHCSHRLIPHFLSMSATPIPRTLSLTVFGDLDLSLITELPKNRKPIITKIVAPENRQKAYDFIRGEVHKGRQVFVICPRIESTQINADSELMSADTYPHKSALNPYKSAALLETKAVKEEYEKLSKKIFPDLRVAMLHGRMPAKNKTADKKPTKEKIMREFANGKIDILVATSVVEVGVDVPNASLMMIEGAERFGLAQLYQFRGRVGRGAHQSYCFLFTEAKGVIATERLRAIEKAKNGFELAEKDLALRGPGEFMGKMQSGMPDIAMKAIQNPELVKRAREAAVAILERDPKLAAHPVLHARLTAFETRVHQE